MQIVLSPATEDLSLIPGLGVMCGTCWLRHLPPVAFFLGSMVSPLIKHLFTLVESISRQ